MQLFYLENPENEIILSPEESKHATKVLRKKQGDVLGFTDGKGGFYKAEITISDTRKCRLQIVSSEQKEKHELKTIRKTEKTLILIGKSSHVVGLIPFSQNIIQEDGVYYFKEITNTLTFKTH